jgi:TDG/mug DNA glycosylase family protein
VSGRAADRLLAPATRRSPRARGDAGAARAVLTDRFCERPRILFVGINPSLRSARVGHHFAGPGNPFWRLLYAARLVPEPFSAEDDVRLPALGLALTNIVPRATRSADEIASGEYAAGRRALARKIARLRPGIVAFVGVTVYRRFFGIAAAGGCGPRPERVGSAQVFVLPNPSGRNAAFPGFRDKLVWYRRLGRLTSPRRDGRPTRREPGGAGRGAGRLRDAAARLPRTARFPRGGARRRSSR